MSLQNSAKYMVIRPRFQMEILQEKFNDVECIADPNGYNCDILIIGYYEVDTGLKNIFGLLGINRNPGNVCEIITNDTLEYRDFLNLCNFVQKKFECDLLICDNIECYEIFKTCSLSGFVLYDASSNAYMVRDYKTAMIMQEYYIRVDMVNKQAGDFKLFTSTDDKVGVIKYNEYYGYYSVLWIEVSDKFAGCGLGKILMQIMINESRYFDQCIKLDSLEKPLGFYKKLGFVPISETQKYNLIYEP